MDDDLAALFSVHERNFRAETFLQSLFHVQQGRATELFCVAFSGGDARRKNFFRVTHGEISRDDDLRHSQLVSGTRKPQNHFCMTGRELIVLDQLLNLEREMEEADNIGN